ncbi:hypothetical protein GCM10020000_33520 [Streptomyces olivoverticillatus]
MKGAIVIARYSATRPRAWSVGTEKKTVEASATVISMSPAEFTACSSISLPRPDSPAPCACVAFRMPRAAPVTGLRSARPTPRAVRRSGPPSADRMAPTTPYCPNWHRTWHFRCIREAEPSARARAGRGAVRRAGDGSPQPGYPRDARAG